MAAPIPIHVVTGFLGAGKTTALNGALKTPALARTAVVVNEFGETGLDHLFFEAASNIVELANGCVCCSIRGELADTLLDLPLADIDRVEIETTGLADPVPVLQLLTTHPELQAQFRFAGMTAFADCLHISVQLEKYSEARRQIALADRIVITKLDMVPEPERADIERDTRAILRRLNRSAAIDPVAASKLGAMLAEPISGRDTGSVQPLDNHHSGEHAEPGHDHASHHSGVQSVVLHHAKPLPYKTVEAFCELLTSAHAGTLLRLKGIVSIVGDARPLAIHCVGGIMHEPAWLQDWPSDDHSTRIVVITDGLEAEFVERLFGGFANIPATDTPDSAAMTGNPLAIPGHSFR